MANWLDRIERRTPTPVIVDTQWTSGSNRPAGPTTSSKELTFPNTWSDGARVALANVGISSNYEGIENDFADYVQNIYKANGVVFACIAARSRIFSQARIAYQKIVKGRPGELFYNDSLEIFDKPWANGAPGELLTHMEVDVSVSGNAYFTMSDEEGNIGPKRINRDANPFISRMRPDWTKLVIGSPSGNVWGVDARVIAAWYMPPNSEPLLLRVGEFAHYSPIPDPEARFRGMSWLTPIIREIYADKMTTQHKIGFLKNGATPNLAVVVPEDTDDDEFEAFVAKFREEYEGSSNAYKTLLLGSGAVVTPLSIDFQQLDLKSMQGALETRIAAAAGVHPTIVGLSEGLQGSSLNEGNFSAARRIATDMTVRDLWAKGSSSLTPLVPTPPRNVRLWYDDRDIPFLREDAKDEANIFLISTQAIARLVDAGYNPDDAVRAAKARDPELLIGKHSGLYSVQLQAAGTQLPPANGNGNGTRQLTNQGSNGNGPV